MTNKRTFRTISGYLAIVHDELYIAYMEDGQGSSDTARIFLEREDEFYGVMKVGRYENFLITRQGEACMVKKGVDQSKYPGPGYLEEFVGHGETCSLMSQIW